MANKKIIPHEIKNESSDFMRYSHFNKDLS